MSLVANWKFDQTDVTIDSTGNSNTLDNFGVGSTTDATFGNVALFDSGGHFRLTSGTPNALRGAASRTISVWINRSSDGDSNTIFDYSTSGSTDPITGANRALFYYRVQDRVLLYERIGSAQRTVTSQPHSINTWYNLAMTYDGTDVKFYVNGSEIYSETGTLNSTIEPLFIGRLKNNSAFFFVGKMSDFRIYDGALDATEMSNLFSQGPNPPPPLEATPRVSTVTSIITPVTGAIAYRLTSQETGSPQENIVANNVTDLEQIVRQLRPETEYTIRLYSTEDGVVYTLADESVVTTLPNVAGNYDKNDYLITSGRFDISTLDSESTDLLSEVINDVFDTGDDIDVKVSGRTKKSKFVNRGGTVDVTGAEAVVAPFSTDGGSGQSISMTLSDSTSVSVAYNETTEDLAIGSDTYNIGDSLVLDGKKITIVDI